MVGRSEALVSDRLLAGIASSNPSGDMHFCLLWVFVFSVRGFCFGLITRPEESHRVWWSWSHDNGEALAHYGLLHQEKKILFQPYVTYRRGCLTKTVFYPTSFSFCSYTNDIRPLAQHWTLRATDPWVWIQFLNRINPLNPELNPICYFLALLGAHHFIHVSRIRVKLLTFRLLMSYIYIYIYIWSTHSWCF